MENSIHLPFIKQPHYGMHMKIFYKLSRSAYVCQKCPQLQGRRTKYILTQKFRFRTMSTLQFSGDKFIVHNGCHTSAKTYYLVATFSLHILFSSTPPSDRTVSTGCPSTTYFPPVFHHFYSLPSSSSEHHPLLLVCVNPITP